MKVRSFSLRCFGMVAFFALVIMTHTACTIEEDINVLRKEARDKLNIHYTVTFNINGGSGTAPSPQKVKEGSSVTLPDEDGFSRDGYFFDGWNTKADGTGSSHDTGASYKVIADVTLYARWDVVTYTGPDTETYTVTFNANGGTGTAPSARTADAGSSIAIPNGDGLSKDGYEFGGWNTNNSGTGTNYNGGASYTPTATITLYARWELTYTVTFNANGGAGTTPNAQTVTAGSIITLPNGDGLSKDGYTFSGWNTQTDGAGTNFGAGAPYTVTGNITLYAKWVEASTVWTVRFETNGGSAVGDATIVRNTAISRPSPDPTRTGYVFDGWFVNAELTAVYNFSSVVTGDITLCAKWNPINYSVAYDKNAADAIGSMTNSSHTYDVDRILYYNDFIRTGYTFAGWARTPSGVAVEFANSASVKNLTATAGATVTLYAQWTLNQYAVTFNADGGTPVPAQQTVDHGGKVSEPTGVTHGNYTLEGWYTEMTFTNKWNFSTGTVTATMTLFARWTYTVTFNANGATSGTAPAAQTVDYGSSITLPSGSGLSRTNYIFGGWNTQADGAGTNYNVGASYKPTVNITLYAKWDSISPEMVRVTGGSFEMGDAGYDYSSPVHTVTLMGFYMGKYQVTQAQYEAVMGSNPSYFKTNVAEGETQNRRPVECVSWYDTLVFCNKLSIAEGLTPAYRISNSTDPTAWGSVPTNSNSTWNAVTIDNGSTGYRLPTEAQWEYAAKGGNGSPGNYTYSGSNDPNEVAWYSSNSGSKTHEVGKKAPNGLGLYDMSGNVWEWCWDWYGSYPSGAQTDPEGASSGSNRVNRGGYWAISAEGVRSAFRYYVFYPTDRISLIGFRLARP